MDNGTLQLNVERVYTFDGDGTLKAFADVAVNEAVLIKGFRVVNGKNGLFVGMPQERSKQGKWFDTVTPLTKTAHAQLTGAIMDAYDAQVNGKR